MTSLSRNNCFVPNWNTLQKLRDCFLEGTFPTSSYWENNETLSQYDSTFGQRIFWKWRSVFGASQEILNWSGQFNLLDWGCGTGIASRSFLECLGVEHVDSVYLFDKSEKALKFAQEKITSLFPQAKVISWNGANQKVDKNLPLVLLVSHVINELSPTDKSELLKLMKKAQVVIWVEPGTPRNSEILIQWREQLRSDFLFALPCTHQNTCGLFQSHSRNWCHFFAKPPALVFQDAFWKLFSVKMKIDLRALPVSFFLAISKSSKAPLLLNPSKDNLQRLLGRARHYKGYSLALTCEDRGVREEKILHRSNRELINIMKENRFLTKFLLH